MLILDKILRKVKQNLIGLKLKSYSTIQPFVLDKVGLEIGGPSAIFKSNNIIPLYTDARQVDGINFSTFTVWEKEIEAGQTYNYDGRKRGIQFIAEASELPEILDDSYDFLLSSHSLEHCANVLKTLTEWKRVLRPQGIMIVVVPNKNFTFDHNRDVTLFEHLVEDLSNNIDEKDLTHLPEIFEKHDLKLDPALANKEEFIARSINNFENRCLHHHVFDINLLTEIFAYLNMKLILTDIQPPFHIIAIAQKI